MSIQDLPFFPIAGSASGDVGKDGVSPTITSAAIDGGHRLTIVDVAGTKTIDIMNGTDGRSGKDGASGVYVGATAPTDVNANVWINPNGEAVSMPTGGSDYQWEKIFELTAEEKVGAVTIPVTGSEYRCLHLRVSAQIWDVSADAVHSANSGIDCEVHGNEGMINKIPFGISGDSTPMEALFINVGDRFAPFVFATNGNAALNGLLFVHNPYRSPFQITESILVNTWSSDHYLFVEGATFELWGVRV